MFWIMYILVMVWLGGGIVAVQNKRKEDPVAHPVLFWLLVIPLFLMGVVLLGVSSSFGVSTWLTSPFEN